MTTLGLIVFNLAALPLLGALFYTLACGLKDREWLFVSITLPLVVVCTCVTIAGNVMILGATL